MKNQIAGFVILCLSMTAKIGHCEATEAIAPDDAKIGYSGYVSRELVIPEDATKGKFVRFDRVIDMPGKGYRWDNPGAVIRFRTDATEIAAILNYSSNHISGSARNSMGVYSVDGVFKREWSFQTRQKPVLREVEVVSAPISNGGVAGFHDYELFLPYGDSVDFAGLKVNPGAKFEPPKAKSDVRYVAYGDSITHGFTSSEVSKSYPFLVGKEKGWETINLGLGGRSSTPNDGKLIASLNPDVVSVLMGANDWQGGVPLEKYRTNMDAFISNIRATQPDVPIYFITFLWVNSSWNPPAKVADLEAYRQVLREVVAARKDPNIFVIEGPELIDQVPTLFDSVPVHPNDKGFAMMAERLGKQINKPAGK